MGLGASDPQSKSAAGETSHFQSESDRGPTVGRLSVGLVQSRRWNTCGSGGLGALLPRGQNTNRNFARDSLFAHQPCSRLNADFCGSRAPLGSEPAAGGIDALLSPLRGRLTQTGKTCQLVLQLPRFDGAPLTQTASDSVSGRSAPAAVRIDGVIRAHDWHPPCSHCTGSVVWSGLSNGDAQSALQPAMLASIASSITNAT